ncbi:cell division protein FtsW [Caenibius tardaugens NBRC 16725]|uniref:Probable peptidoglycan glycosyltransferase FtsW n=1 Tax=Caenibius tardaugens NBRC 16725 TaxID=1219035 RepID=U2ZVS8_9SPHN|nr:cell division protein FtsW [Caenibius tardaugens NBRC 16725]TXH00901.1 MAG: cell division protein FtsW [Rhodocyclaceae bacterium]GAD49479.1 cell division protein FtsW [Caenibius tardaugens NBRC 16725]
MNAGSRPYIPGPGERTGRPASARRDRRTEIRIWWREIDRTLLFIVLLLMTFGSLAVAVASPASAHRLSTSAVKLPDLHFFWMHLRWQFLGLIAMISVSMLPREVARRTGILLGAAMLVLLVLVPLVGSEVNGAKRWLKLGLTIQPSEFLKPAFAIGLAWILSWRLRDHNLPVVAISGGVMALVGVLLMLQPDFGSTILFAGVWFVLILLSGIPVKRMGWLMGVGVAGLTAAYFLYDNARHRIDAFLGGGTAFDQVDLASRALLAGGWTGSGMWLGVRKMSLPEAHTDYIFSVIGEEFGLLACGLVVLLYLAFTVRVLVRLVDEEDLFTILAAAGLTAQIGGQAFINILVNLQLFPSKGMTLPLISYGGSSTVALCLTVGFLLAITRRNPFLSREKFDWKHALSTGDMA